VETIRKRIGQEGWLEHCAVEDARFLLEQRDFWRNAYDRLLQSLQGSQPNTMERAIANLDPGGVRVLEEVITEIQSREAGEGSEGA
jgi:hypothetical protein